MAKPTNQQLVYDAVLEHYQHKRQTMSQTEAAFYIIGFMESRFVKMLSSFPVSQQQQIIESLKPPK